MEACLAYCKAEKPLCAIFENVVQIRHAPAGDTSALELLVSSLEDAGYCVRVVEADVQTFHSECQRNR